MDFETYWNLFSPSEDFTNRKEPARRLWAQHPEKHEPIIRWLRAHGSYKGRNPYFFIQDFQVKQSPIHAEPTFLRGDEPGDLVQVRYNGLYKICTRETMKEYGLEYVRDW